MFAVVDIAGFQEVVKEGMKLKVPSFSKEKEGATMKFEKVLLLADGESLSFGAPYVSGASIQAKVLRHGRADKIRVVKAHRRKRYRRVHGHRQGFTELEITGIMVK